MILPTFACKHISTNRILLNELPTTFMYTQLRKRLWRALLLYLLASVSYAQPIILNDPKKSYPISEHCTVLEVKPGQKITVDSLLKFPEKYLFATFKKQPTRTKPTKDRWFRFEMRSDLQTPVCLYSARRLPVSAGLYLVQNNQLEKKYTLGKEDETLHSAFPLPIRKAWPLLLQPNRTYVVYWHSAELPQTVEISAVDHLFSLFYVEDVFVGFYYGFALIIILYNLLLYNRLKDLDHLIYATWVGLNAFVAGINFGYFYNWMPGYYDFFAEQIIVL